MEFKDLQNRIQEYQRVGKKYFTKEYNLPEHPMDSEGYMSIGCEPCTRKIDPNMSDREARWFGLNKTECGLHTDLIEK